MILVPRWRLQVRNDRERAACIQVGLGCRVWPFAIDHDSSHQSSQSELLATGRCVVLVAGGASFPFRRGSFENSRGIQWHRRGVDGFFFTGLNISSVNLYPP
jgi:hypothetical protein